MLKMNVYQIVDNQIAKVEVAAPIILTSADKFATAVNARLLEAYKVEADVKRMNTVKTLEKAAADMKAAPADSEELGAATVAHEKAVAKLAAIDSLIKSINATTAPATENLPSFIEDGAKMFSYLYSNARAMILKDNGGATVQKGYLAGVPALFTAVCEYADKYSDAEGDWNAVRVEEFKALKRALAAIGARLNNEGAGDFKKFTYAPTSGAVNELVSRYRKYSDFRKKSGKFTDKRDKIDAFQKSVITVIFRLDKTVTPKNEYIED